MTLTIDGIEGAREYSTTMPLIKHDRLDKFSFFKKFGLLADSLLGELFFFFYKIEGCQPSSNDAKENKSL